MKRPALICALLFSSIASAQNDVPFLTVTSTDGQNLVEFQNPPLGAYERTRIIGRNDRFALSFDDIDLGQPLFVVDVQGIQGKRSFVLHSGLTNGATYFYTAFVNGGGGWSIGTNVKGVPVDTTGAIRWRFFTGTGATLMSPPGIGSVLLVVSNDNNVYPLERGPDGGVWAPNALPIHLDEPAQHRPSVVPSGGVADTQNLTAIASQDGKVRGVDADSGRLLWVSDDFGMLLGAPAFWLSVFSGGPDNLIYVGSRNVGARNALHALDAVDGHTVWSFDDPGGAGIGIISGGISIDYRAGAAYFASAEIAPGADTVWAVDLMTGQKIWSSAIGSVSGSAVQRGNYLYAGADDGKIHAIDVRDGAQKLNFPFDTQDGMTKGFVFPNFSGTELYLSTETTVWSLRDVDPVVILRWLHQGIPGPSIPTYPPGRQFLWVGSRDGRLYQLDVTTGNPSQAPDTRFVALTDGSAAVGSPSFDLVHGLVYVGTEDGAVYAVQAPY